MADTIRLKKNPKTRVAQAVVGCYGLGPFPIIEEEKICKCGPGGTPLVEGEHYADCRTLFVTISAAGFKRDIRLEGDVELPQSELVTA